MGIILIVVVLVLLLGGGSGYYGYTRYGGSGLGGLLVWYWSYSSYCGSSEDYTRSAEREN
jgi:hypothetical protein